MNSILPERFTGVAVANKLCQAWEDAGGTPTDMNNLATHPDLVQDFLDILKGKSKKYRFEVNADDENPLPYKWGEWKIHSHTPQGVHEWSPDLFRYVDVVRRFGELHLEKGFPISKLHEDVEYKDYNFANSCFVKFLVRYPALVPKEWRQYKRLFFLGTVFVSDQRDRRVVFFYNGEKERFVHWDLEETYFRDGDFIALLKKDE